MTTTTLLPIDKPTVQRTTQRLRDARMLLLVDGDMVAQEFGGLRAVALLLNAASEIAREQGVPSWQVETLLASVRDDLELRDVTLSALPTVGTA